MSTPYEFALHGGQGQDSVELSVDRNNAEHPVQISMSPWLRTPANEHVPAMSGFLTGAQVDELIDVLTTLRERMRP